MEQHKPIAATNNRRLQLQFACKRVVFSAASCLIFSAIAFTLPVIGETYFKDSLAFDVYFCSVFGFLFVLSYHLPDFHPRLILIPLVVLFLGYYFVFNKGYLLAVGVAFCAKSLTIILHYMFLISIIQKNTSELTVSDMASLDEFLKRNSFNPEQQFRV